MAAYIIADLTITDPEGFERYRAMVPPTLEQFGARYVVRGGKLEALEGDWEPKRLVVIEFTDAETARAWHDCEAYREAKALRQRTTKGNLILVEGV